MTQLAVKQGRQSVPLPWFHEDWPLWAGSPVRQGDDLGDCPGHHELGDSHAHNHCHNSEYLHHPGKVENDYHHNHNHL